MIHKVSVVKKITYLMMTMALAVAMMACSGAAGTPGPAGPAGPAGEDAPTPDPTPTTPTTPTTPPTEPTGAAPEVTMMFPDVYLTLAGDGDKTYSVDLRNHITDADSLLRYTVASLAPTVAEAEEKNSMLTVTPQMAGDAMITVTGHDDEGGSSISDEFMVTVVATNAAPTTSGLNVSDVNELQKKLYIVEGLRPDTVTVRSTPGAAPTVEDSIVDKFKVVIGKDDKGKDDLVIVMVKKGTEDHKYVIDVTPKAKALNMSPQKVQIYPMDKFGAMVSKPWEFNATFNKSPSVLKDSFGTVELHRGGGTPDTITGEVTGIPASAADPVTFATLIKVSEYFRTVHFDNAPDGTPDSSCTVSAGNTGLAVVQELNALGADLVTAATFTVPSNAADAAGQTTYRGSSESPIDKDVVTGIVNGGVGAPGGTAFKLSDHVRGPGEALDGILIDSRYSSYGTDEIDNVDLVASAITTPAIAADADVRITGKSLDSFTVTLTCMDKDGSDEVTGKVVVRGNTVTPSS